MLASWKTRTTILESLQEIAGLSSANLCHTTFSGKIKLIGFDFQPNSEDARPQHEVSTEDKATLKLYWQFLGRIKGNYRPIIQFCNKNWQPVIKKMTKFTKNQKPYLKSSSLCGEVIVDKIEISEDPKELPYLRIGILSPERNNSPSEFLKTDENSSWLITAFVR